MTDQPEGFVTPEDVENVEVDVDNPGDAVTTEEEDDDPQSLAGDEVDEEGNNN